MADIVEIGELRLQRIIKSGSCPHNKLEYDEHKQYIQCVDCKLPVTPWTAFMVLVRHYGRATQELKERRQELDALEKDKLLLKATRQIDAVWRSRKLLPCCPHCGRGIAPEDGLGNGHQVGKQYEMARRRKEKEKVT